MKTIRLLLNLWVSSLLNGCNFPLVSHAWTVQFTQSYQHCKSSTTTTQLCSFTNTSPQSSKASNASRRDSDDDNNARIQHVVDLARKLGPVGALRSSEEQDAILRAALELQSWSSDPRPAHIPLTGQTYDLLYSAATGASSGKIGIFIGKVTQEFVNDEIFINAVEFGPIQIALRASRQIRNDSTIEVRFLQTSVYLFGNQILERSVQGGGTWNIVFVGELIMEDGSKRRVRILQTPSLFVLLEQPQQ